MPITVSLLVKNTDDNVSKQIYMPRGCFPTSLSQYLCLKTQLPLSLESVTGLVFQLCCLHKDYLPLLACSGAIVTVKQMLCIRQKILLPTLP